MVAHIDVNLTDISCNQNIHIQGLKAPAMVRALDGPRCRGLFTNYGNSRNLRIRIAGFTGMNVTASPEKRADKRKTPTINCIFRDMVVPSC